MEMNLNQALLEAAARAALERLDALIASGADVNARNQYGETPLFLVAKRDHAAETLVSLIRQGARLDVQDETGQTPLMRACLYQQLDNLHVLLDAGVDLEIRDQRGQTALGVACGNDNPDVVRALLDQGANVNSLDNRGQTPLSIAVQFPESVEVARLLITRQADVDLTRNEMGSPLMCAIAKQNAALIALLIDQGAELLTVRNIEGENAIELAQRIGNETIRAMLDDELGSRNQTYDPDASKQLDAALIEAAENGAFAQMETLLDQGAFVQVQGREEQSLLHVVASQPDSVAVMKRLVDRGLSVNARDARSYTPLMHAVRAGRPENARYLLDQGAAVNAMGHHGKTALMLAVATRNMPLIRLLLEHRANLDEQDNEGETPLMMAVDLKDEVMVTYLLDNNADINAPGDESGAPIFNAIYNEDIAFVTLLIQHNADLDELVNWEFKTAYEVAQDVGNIDILNLIESALK